MAKKILRRFLVFMVVPPIVMFSSVMVGIALPEEWHPAVIVLGSIAFVISFFQFH